MLSLSIKEDYSKLTKDSIIGRQDRTCTFLGDIISMLETDYPEAINGDPCFFVSDLIQEIQGTKTARYIWGMKERGISLVNFNDFIAGRENLSPSMLEVERLRIDNGILNAPSVNHDGSMDYYRIQSVFEVIYAMLYYYSFHEYTLKRCKFCGKWFAVKKTSAQENYCSRKPVYTDCYGRKHKYDSCQDAREKIAARSDQRQKRIYNRLYQSGGIANGQINSFLSSCDYFREKRKTDPSSENLSQYEKYLYIDCEKLYPRYSRK